EDCKLAIEAKALEETLDIAGVIYTGGGLNAPLTKDGLRLGIEGGYGKVIRETSKKFFPGQLILTNQRVIFVTSENRSFQIPLQEILKTERYQDGLEIIIAGKNYLLLA